MFLLNTENKISLVGDSLASWFDIEPADLEGAEITSLVVEADIPRLRSALTAARQAPGQEKQKFSCRLATDDEHPTVEIDLSPSQIHPTRETYSEPFVARQSIAPAKRKLLTRSGLTTFLI